MGIKWTYNLLLFYLLFWGCDVSEYVLCCVEIWEGEPQFSLLIRQHWGQYDVITVLWFSFWQYSPTKIWKSHKPFTSNNRISSLGTICRYVIFVLRFQFNIHSPNIYPLILVLSILYCCSSVVILRWVSFRVPLC